MSIDAEIRLHLTSSPAITALVAPASISCAGEIAQGEKLPAITILTTSFPEPDLAGNASVERTVAELEIAAIDSDTEHALARAKRIADAVRARLHCFRGTWGTLSIQGVFLTQSNDLEADPDTGIHGISLEFEVWHR